MFKSAWVRKGTPNRVTQVKTLDTDGYSAIQVTAGSKKASRVTKPEAGHFAKAGVEAGRGLWEFRLEENEGTDIKVGAELSVELFNDITKVDVTGQSKGKGFQGGIKRWNFSMQDATHGNSLSHRSNGSIGMCQTVERNLLLIKGAVPGAKNGDVFIKPAVKA